MFLPLKIIPQVYIPIRKYVDHCFILLKITLNTPLHCTRKVYSKYGIKILCASFIILLKQHSTLIKVYLLLLWTVFMYDPIINIDLARWVIASSTNRPC